ncbi:hypothetical protein GCM10011581_38380 [Saccharopolyspora subtropica]|uniref:Uncharacterized protein n=1 Tax=Saccharopolyspora thermophila TaxID=89367 RepID=A0A917K3G2_9PSEU|nr:hypothetical protein GCM10011581_38380 [Saccharopolyspora subtropica]
MSLSGSSDARTWWAPWADVVPDWFKTFVGLEGLARSEFNYETALLPGLLQTGVRASSDGGHGFLGGKGASDVWPRGVVEKLRRGCGCGAYAEDPEGPALVLAGRWAALLARLSG